MAKRDLLIVTPTRLSFQAPFPHPQRRLLSLLNPNAQPLIYQVRSTNNSFYSAEPASGKVEAFDTTDVNITLKPVPQELPSGGFSVKCVTADVAQLADWCDDSQLSTTKVSVSLDATMAQSYEDNALRLRLRLQGGGIEARDLIEQVEQQQERQRNWNICESCAHCRMEQESSSWNRCGVWLALSLICSGIVYCCWEALADFLSLSSEPAY